MPELALNRVALLDALARAGRHKELLLVAAVVAVLVAIVVPLPPLMLDFLLVGNIALALVILLTTIYVREPLQFSVFPSLLLVTTIYRLALNIATTRLILAGAKEHGNEAAGVMVKAFGTFVAGDSPLIGFVIFSIIIIVQFVVITKGATRVSEVAARFTLDAMPGKQMAIDADLNAGMIDEKEARHRREDISQQADFYGAMDGASKFVRGDAIAGIIITLINIIGGLILGTLIYSLPLAEAVVVYTTLTVGDGLVSQLPALVISVAAGLLVTRSGSKGPVGEALVGQLVSAPRALYITSGVLSLLVFTPLPTIPLLLLGGSLAGSAYLLGQLTAREEKVKSQAAAAKDKPSEPEQVNALLQVDAMELEVGYGLIRVVDAAQGGDLLERITMLRRQVAQDLGLVVPPIRIRDNMTLRPEAYRIKIRGTEVAKGAAYGDQFLAMDSGLSSEPLDGIRTTEPAFGLPATWIGGALRPRAEALGYTVVTPSSVLATHITEIIRTRAGRLLGREDVRKLLDNVKAKTPALVDEVVPEPLKVGEVQRVLQNLLDERVSIRDLTTILETLGDYGRRTKDVEVLTEYCRAALSRTITESVREADGRIYCITLEPGLEDLIRGGIEQTERGSFLALPAATVQDIIRKVSDGLTPLVERQHSPVILTSPQIRLIVKRMFEQTLPSLTVLSYPEIAPGVEVEAVAVVTLA